jgi:hypothetical protein
MAPKHRTATEQKFWDKVFRQRFPVCLGLTQEGHSFEGCAQLAAEQADAALAARRRSQQQDK